MGFTARFEARQRQLNEKKYTERHVEYAFVGGVVAGGLMVACAFATLSLLKTNKGQQNQTIQIEPNTRSD